MIRVNNLIAAICFSIAVTLYLPMDFVATNSNELWFKFNDLIGLQVTVFTLFTLITLLIFSKISEKLILFLLLLAIIFYAQSHFTLGLLNNTTAVNSKSDFIDNLIGIILWILVPTLFFCLYKKNSSEAGKFIYRTSIILVLVQITILFFSFYDNKNESSKIYTTNNGILEVGKDQNIIVFIMDSFSPDMYEWALEKNGSKSDFSDFSKYTNVSSNFNYTTPSIPNIITGISYDNSVPYNDYINNAFKSSKILDLLDSKSFDVSFYTIDKALPLNDPYYAPLIKNTSAIGVYKKIQLSAILVKISIYKILPEPLKNLIEIDYNAFERLKESSYYLPFVNVDNPDARLFKKINEEGLTLKNGNFFKFIHLQSVHQPITIDENFRLNSNSKDSDLIKTYKQGAASLKVVSSYINRLKSIPSVYENTTIFITADHGAISDPTLGFYKPPLLLAKFESSIDRSKLITNYPVVNSDIFNTVKYILGDTNYLGSTKYPPPNLIKAHQNRKRNYYFYDGFEKTKSGYLPNLYEFDISPRCSDPSCFQRTGKIYTDGGVIDYIPPTYSYGDVINANNTAFNWGDKSLNKFGYMRILNENLYGAGSYFYPSSFSASIKFRSSKISNSLIYSMYARKSDSSLPNQRVILKEGKKLLCEFNISDVNYKTYSCLLPRFFGDLTDHEILIETPDAVIGSCELNFICTYASIKIASAQINDLPKSRKYSFNNKDIVGYTPGSEIIRGNWNAQESTHIFTKGSSAFSILMDPNANNEITIESITSIPPNFIRIKYDNIEVPYKIINISGKLNNGVRFYIPSKYIADNPAGEIMIEILNPIYVNDDRILGLAISTVEVKSSVHQGP